VTGRGEDEKRKEMEAMERVEESDVDKDDS